MSSCDPKMGWHALAAGRTSSWAALRGLHLYGLCDTPRASDAYWIFYAHLS